MIKKLWQDKYLLFLVLFIIAFLFFTNYQIHETQGWDESRHAVLGHLMYDYFQTLLSGDWMSFREFMSLYQQKGYNAGWFLIDPPFHAIVQGSIFLFLGASPVTASLATELFMIIGAFLLYFLSLKILQKKHLALAVAALYLISPALLNIGGLSMLEIPISFMMVGWYYFTFHREGKTFALRLSPGLRLSFKLNTLYGALFLAAATLMKYQSLVYVAAFYLLYGLYLWRKEKKFPLALLKTGFGQGIIVLLLSAWWIKLSLFDYGFLKRLTELSLTYQEPQWTSPSYVFAYLIQTVKETSYLALLVIIPVVMWFKQKKESFLSQNARLGIFILTVYIVATVLITSQQLRYAIHVLPFLFILMVKGLDDLAEFLKEKIKFRQAFAVLAIALVVVSGVVSYGVMDRRLEKRGTYSYELVNFISTIPDPKLLLNIDGDLKSPGFNYYYNQDLFVFEAMMANDRKGIHNPEEMQQYAQIISGRAITDYEQVAQQASATAQQIKTVIVVFKNSNPNVLNISALDAALTAAGFSRKELQWYWTYQKG